MMDINSQPSNDAIITFAASFLPLVEANVDMIKTIDQELTTLHPDLSLDKLDIGRVNLPVARVQMARAAFITATQTACAVCIQTEHRQALLDICNQMKAEVQTKFESFPETHTTCKMLWVQQIQRGIDEAISMCTAT